MDPQLCDTEKSFGKCASWKKREPCMIVGRCFSISDYSSFKHFGCARSVRSKSFKRMAVLQAENLVTDCSGMVLRGAEFNSGYIMIL